MTPWPQEKREAYLAVLAVTTFWHPPVVARAEALTTARVKPRPNPSGRRARRTANPSGKRRKRPVPWVDPLDD